MPDKSLSDNSLDDFLAGKSMLTQELFMHFIEQFQKIGPVMIYPAKSMIGIATSRKRIAWVTQLGKNFVHVVFPFEIPYNDNLCFQKIAKVPGDDKQFNHHFRMLAKKDMNDEVRKFMQIAYAKGS